MILGCFWRHFGVQKPFEIRCHFLVDVLGPGPGATRLQRDFNATSTRLRREYFLGRSPQGGAFSRAEGYYNDPGTQTRDPTRPGPEARRILLLPYFSFGAY